MNNCLILFTNYYPYFKGEEYLESEIEYLSKNFNDIIIISTMVSSSMEQTREIPANVKAFPIGINHSLIGKAKMFNSNLKKIFNDSEKKNYINIDCNNLIKKIYCYYFESRAIEVYKRVCDILNNFKFSQYDDIKIYSYWLYITARVGIEVKNDYFKNISNKVTLISRAHRYDLYELNSPLKYLPERKFLLENLNYIFPCSEDGVDELMRKYSKYSSKISVRRLGTVDKKVKSKTTNEILKIVSCSVVRKVKRLELIIDALEVLEKNNIPYIWTHIGNGPEFDKIKKSAYRKLNSDNFNLVGYMKNIDVLKWYENNESTVFINVSSSEGVPVSIMEAISMGIPVIATNVGGTKEIVYDNVNGYILDKNFKNKELVKLLIDIKEMDLGKYRSMSYNARRIWEEKCDANKLYRDFANELVNL
ncbi:glycosyltransferase [Clostridium perfringens]|uniref:glycosyltransferase n=1 Tax=Clostridium perfringens TaxID=1502 RepID=UPI0018E4A628|nr:glycosyltransferase [Clostridium perfringens]MBI6027018.1 glycosyltransferase [Clostridium perfringens]